MEKIVIAFDIDGTLRCNCTSHCQDMNEDVVLLAELLGSMKNTKLIAWSGGGAEYARQFVHKYPRLRDIFGDKCYSKFYNSGGEGMPDIAIDDQQDFTLGKVNLIVRMK